jgi:DNA-binding transcriptional ArsR family regulator
MVKHRARQHLDRIFGALVDESRREILAQLERENYLGGVTGLSVSDLARPLPISLPAVMKHLDVLEHAGLISRSKQGRTVTVRLQPEPMKEALQWLRRYERFWSERLDRLARQAERAEAQLKRTER